MPKNLPGQAPKRLTGNRTKPPTPRLWRMRDKMPWLPYVLPLALFILLTGLEETFKAVYPLYYTVKIAAVTALLVLLWRFLPEARPQQRTGLGLAAALGILLTFVWILGDYYTPHLKFLGSRIGYDPFQEIPNPVLRTLFLIVRFFGLVIIVPIIEEVFYRGFLLRFVTDPDDFRRVAIGRFSMGAFLFNIVFMSLSHPEWLVAGIFSAAMCALIARTRNLFACIVAHGVTNLMLGAYVLQSHQWQYW